MASEDDLKKSYYEIASEEAARLKGTDPNGQKKMFPTEPTSDKAASVTDIVKSIIDEGIEPGTDAFYQAIDAAVYGRESDGGPEPKGDEDEMMEAEQAAQARMMKEQ